MMPNKATAQIIDGRVCVITTDGFHTEWPIQYKDGRIAYDNPYRVPKYIRPTVAKLFRQINEVRR